MPPKCTKEGQEGGGGTCIFLPPKYAKEGGEREREREREMREKD
jgi:hypothetical protein